MKAAVFTGQKTVETREEPNPKLGEGDVLIRMRSCGVCGTDVRKVQFSLVRPPVILGHEVAGDVVEVGPNVTKFKVGDRVVVAHHTPCFVCHYCRHENFSMCKKFKSSNLDPGGFAEYVRIPKEHVEMTAHKIPQTLTYDQAVFMEPLACVLRNLKRAKTLPGDTVLIVGLGSMGLLTGQMVQHFSGHVIATDLRDDRRALGQRLGFETLDGTDPNLKDKVLKATDGRGVDVVILTAGNEEVYSGAISFVRDGGSVNVFAGLAPGAKLNFDANELYSREITVYSSYSPSPIELKEALVFLEHGIVNVDILEAKPYELKELGSAIDAVQMQSILKAIIHPEEATA